MLKNTDWCRYTTQACIAQVRNSRSALESAEAYAQQNCFFIFKMKLDLSDYLLANTERVAVCWGHHKSSPVIRISFFSALAAAFFSIKQSSAEDQHNSGTWRQPMILFQCCSRKDSGPPPDRGIDKQGLDAPCWNASAVVVGLEQKEIEEKRPTTHFNQAKPSSYTLSLTQEIRSSDQESVPIRILPKF